MKELLLYMAKNLVDSPDSVSVTEIEGETTVLELRVAPEDMGKLIGRQGRIAKEIRTIVKSVAQRSGQKVSVEIVDGRKSRRRHSLFRDFFVIAGVHQNPIYWIICLFLSEFVEWLIRCHIIIRCCLKGGSMV